jgi:hypothetical protein
MIAPGFASISRRCNSVAADGPGVNGADRSLVDLDEQAAPARMTDG